MSDRRLTLEEQDVLIAVVDADVPDLTTADAVRAQIRVATVTGVSCQCGCPSYSLVVARDLAPPAPLTEINAGYGDEDGGGFRVLLDDGYLCDVEIYWYGDKVPSEWPAAEQVH